MPHHVGVVGQVGLTPERAFHVLAARRAQERGVPIGPSSAWTEATWSLLAITYVGRSPLHRASCIRDETAAMCRTRLRQPDAQACWLRLWRALNVQHALVVATDLGMSPEFRRSLADYAQRVRPCPSPALWRTALQSARVRDGGAEASMRQVIDVVLHALTRPRARSGLASQRPGPLSGAEVVVALDCTRLGARFDAASPDFEIQARHVASSPHWMSRGVR